jgi:hypothetical protein
MKKAFRSFVRITALPVVLVIYAVYGVQGFKVVTRAIDDVIIPGGRGATHNHSSVSVCRNFSFNRGY